jgi:hypothetical protein
MGKGKQQRSRYIWRLLIRHALTTIVIFEKKQVDFAHDERWNAWNEAAIRRFLKAQPTKRTVCVETMWNQDRISPGIPNKAITESWSRANGDDAILVTPTVLNRRREVNETEQVYGDVKQAVALEDDVWDLGMVSWMLRLT